jgi:hypothetical protein
VRSEGSNERVGFFSVFWSIRSRRLMST